ncbi:MAG TPA: YlqF/YawG family GTPase, partial [Verrucomicrobiae bacterium]|nr:YlqF/YawG family GTPase [Verrucomicrobiae bacterium]
DLVVEVVDARVPRSGRNPMLDRLAAHRARVVVLNRHDLAHPQTTKEWVEHFAAQGVEAVPTDGRSQPGVARVATAMRHLTRGVRGSARALVVGIPNSGKSSIINGLLRRAAAKTENRAGVTRALQWFRLQPNIELMDTPGILVPKIATKAAQWKLALVGAVPRTHYDPEEVVAAFHRWLHARDPHSAVPDLETFAAARFTRRGGEIDYHNAAQAYIRTLGEGTFGRISLEAPDDRH